MCRLLTVVGGLEGEEEGKEEGGRREGGAAEDTCVDGAVMEEEGRGMRGEARPCGCCCIMCGGGILAPPTGEATPIAGPGTPPGGTPLKIREREISDYKIITE